MTIETGFDSNYRKVLVAAVAPASCRAAHMLWSRLTPPNPAASPRMRSAPAKSLTSKPTCPSSNPQSKARPFLSY